ncbi:MAG: GerMN domain-containing protein [Defluviitaleaceae bacterium]|nr:GerMN domain-containing protein [Defluviitaleaceae bacterium]
MPKKTQKKPVKGKIRWVNVGIVCALAVLVGVGSFLLFSRGDEEIPIEPLPPDIEYVIVSFHFPTVNFDGWEQETRQIELSNEDVMIRAVVSELASGPRRADLAPSFPLGLRVLWIEYSEAASRVDISFFDEFNELSSSERIRLIGSMVYTLTGLEFVRDLQFFVGEGRYSPVFGEQNALRNRGNTSLGGDIPEPTLTQFVLYFPDEQMMDLIAETRYIHIDELIAERYEFLVEALMQGPRDEGLSPAFITIPTLNRASRSADMVFVDFAPDFITGFTGGTTAEEMMIFSLVNTLTELSGVRAVQILIDGQPVTYEMQGAFHMNLSQPIERNEYLILTNED